MPGDTVFRRFAALPRAIVAHLIAAEPLCRSVFMPRQTWFRSYQKCCRGAIPASCQPVTTPQAGGSKFGSCKTGFSRA